ncbi:MAG TPA: hypothetical protein VGP32_12800 [Steroidobacteraceae bacterium]|jgi:hypothetical protein|nr:hypothetical protein [Steroidobacteraceae bacterium]
MQTRILAALLCGCTLVSAAVAETLVVNDQVQVRESQTATPKRGSTMTDVEKQFGAPVTRHPTVGGGSPHQPPITRWDYNGFSVVFERDRVIDAVVVASAAPAGAVPSGGDAAAPAGTAPTSASPPTGDAAPTSAAAATGS